MLKRKKFKWNVVLAGEDGSMHEIPFESMWDPAKVDTSFIAETACAELGKSSYKPVSAVLVG